MKSFSVTGELLTFPLPGMVESIGLAFVNLSPKRRGSQPGKKKDGMQYTKEVVFSVNVPFKTKEEWQEILKKENIELDLWIREYLTRLFEPTSSDQVESKRISIVSFPGMYYIRGWRNIYDLDEGNLDITDREFEVAFSLALWLSNPHVTLDEFDRIVVLGNGARFPEDEEDGEDGYFIPLLTKNKDGRWGVNMTLPVTRYLELVGLHRTGFVYLMR